MTELHTSLMAWRMEHGKTTDSPEVAFQEVFAIALYGMEAFTEPSAETFQTILATTTS